MVLLFEFSFGENLLPLFTSQRQRGHFPKGSRGPTTLPHLPYLVARRVRPVARLAPGPDIRERRWKSSCRNRGYSGNDKAYTFHRPYTSVV